MLTLTTGREDITSMEAVAQSPPETASGRTTAIGGGVASDRLRVHAHLYKPRLKTSSTVPAFQAELRQHASKQGRNAALEYATALGATEYTYKGPQQTLWTFHMTCLCVDATITVTPDLHGCAHASVWGRCIGLSFCYCCS